MRGQTIFIRQRISSAAAVLLLGCVYSFAELSRSNGIQVDGQSAIDYLLSLQKQNGAFGPALNNYTDLAWNYPAVHALILLGQQVPRADDALANGEWSIFDHQDSHHRDDWWEMYQKAHLNKLLGGDGPEQVEADKNWNLNYTDREMEFNWRYVEGTYSDMPTLWYMVSALDARGGTVSNANSISEYVSDRQSSSGGFVDGYNNSPIMDSEANIMITHHAVMTLTALNQAVPNQDAVIAWIKSCQTPSGGFRWHPDSELTGNMPDVWYTWGAVRALQALGSEPDDAQGAVAWLNSLQNSDGGFGDKPGWESRVYSTYYAIHALEVLTGEALGAITTKTVLNNHIPIPDNEYFIFVAYLNGPEDGSGGGQSGQPGMIEQMYALGFDLIGVKTDGNVNAVNTAQDYVESRGYDMVVVASPENYPHRARFYGGLNVDHFSNWIIPPDLTAQQEDTWNTAEGLANDNLPWDDFRQQVLSPVFEIGTLFYPEWEWTMVYAYQLYDEGLNGLGWNAVPATLGHPVWDWTRMFPYREKWHSQLPAIVAGDSHSDVNGWMQSLLKQRMLYLAKENSYEAFLDAARNKRVMTVIHDEDVNTSGTSFYGDWATIHYALRHQDQWRWDQVPELDPISTKPKKKARPDFKNSLKISRQGSNLKIFLEGTGSYGFKLSDVKGKLHAQFSGLTGDKWQSVPAGHLNPGIYTVSVEKNKGGLSTSLIVLGQH